MSKKTILVNVGLLLIAAVIVVAPLVIVKDSEFEGADGKVAELVEEANEDFEPWAASFWEPPGGETESMFFAIQAALGARVIWYCIGYLKGKNNTNKS